MCSADKCSEGTRVLVTSQDPFQNSMFTKLPENILQSSENLTLLFHSQMRNPIS